MILNQKNKTLRPKILDSTRGCGHKGRAPPYSSRGCFLCFPKIAPSESSRGSSDPCFISPLRIGERRTPDPNGRTENGWKKCGRSPDHDWSIRPFGAHPPSSNMFFSLQITESPYFLNCTCTGVNLDLSSKKIKGEQVGYFLTPHSHSLPLDLFVRRF